MKHLIDFLKHHSRSIDTYLLVLIILVSIFYGAVLYDSSFLIPKNKVNHLGLIPEIIIWKKVESIIILCLVVISIFLVNRFRTFFSNHYHLVLLIALGVLMFSLYPLAVKTVIGTDEREHLQSSWKILSGLQPYSEFFQHHHPFLWYQNTPILHLFGPNSYGILSARFVQVTFLIGILIVVYQISITITPSKENGYLAVFLLLTLKFFIKPGIEIRPDTEQTFFCLLGYLYFLKFLKDYKINKIILSGIFIGIGFLYLQKALFFLFPLSIVGVYLLIRKKFTFQHGVIYALSFLTTASLLYFYYLIMGGGKEYIFFNWILNFYKTTVEGSWKYYYFEIVYNSPFLFLMVLSAIFFAFNWSKLPLFHQITFFMGVMLFFIAFMNPRAWLQYYVPSFPFLAISIAYFLQQKIGQIAPSLKLTLVIIYGTLAIPIFIKEALNKDNNKMLNTVRLQQQEQDEYFFDEKILYNLFHQDPHFFWFSTHSNRMYDAYLLAIADPKNDWLIRERHDDFDFCELVSKYKPLRFYQRTRSRLKLDNCPTLQAKYKEISPMLFQRIE